jgi:hypothetical protein
VSAIAPLLCQPLDGLHQPQLLGRPFGLWEAAAALGVTGGCHFALDVGEIMSDPGAGQLVQDLSGRGLHFHLGADATVSATDPARRGRPGSRDPDTYLAVDGGDYLTVAGGNDTGLAGMHKDGAVWSLVMAFSTPDVATAAGLAGTKQASAGEAGMLVELNTDETVQLRLNGGATNRTIHTSTAAVSTSAVNLLAWVLDEAGGAGASMLWLNGVAETFDGALVDASSTNAARALCLFARGLGQNPMPSGAKFYSAMLSLNRKLTAGHLGSMRSLLAGRGL